MLHLHGLSSFILAGVSRSRDNSPVAIGCISHSANDPVIGGSGIGIPLPHVNPYRRRVGWLCRFAGIIRACYRVTRANHGGHANHHCAPQISSARLEARRRGRPARWPTQQLRSKHLSPSVAQQMVLSPIQACCRFGKPLLLSLLTLCTINKFVDPAQLVCIGRDDVFGVIGHLLVHELEKADNKGIAFVVFGPALLRNRKNVHARRKTIRHGKLRWGRGGACSSSARPRR